MYSPDLDSIKKYEKFFNQPSGSKPVWGWVYGWVDARAVHPCLWSFIGLEIIAGGEPDGHGATSAVGPGIVACAFAPKNMFTLGLNDTISLEKFRKFFNAKFSRYIF